MRNCFRCKSSSWTRLKIAATINNAQRFLEIRKEFGSFDKYTWSFVGGKPIVHKFKTIKHPATSKESDALSADLKARGPTKFPAVCYVNLFYTIFIPVVIGGMLGFVLLDAARRILNRLQKSGSR